MQRFGTVTKVKPGRLTEYIRLHNEIPDEVVAAAHQYGLRNFNIYYWNGLLFSYFEYVGENFKADMIEKNSLPAMRRWRMVCDDCFERMEGQEEFDISMEQIFHHSF